jgi:hypothetical protein
MFSYKNFMDLKFSGGSELDSIGCNLQKSLFRFEYKRIDLFLIPILFQIFKNFIVALYCPFRPDNLFLHLTIPSITLS